MLFTKTDFYIRYNTRPKNAKTENGGILIMQQLETVGKIRENMKKTMVGKDRVIDLMLIALICSGHVLIEDVPGLGKTALVSALADSLGCSFKRIQFTPDVLPSDITGFNIYNMNTGKKEFQPGLIMNNIILADEINRTTPKTQSALLEAMQERQVTVEGATIKLKRPFMVLATQNPVDMAGTYPLPEAQLDRFLMKISIGYPSAEEELGILLQHKTGQSYLKTSPVASAEDVVLLQDSLYDIHCGSDIMRYIISVAEKTRSHPEVLVGVSPRGSIALFHAACAHAMISGREYCTPDDVKAVAIPVLQHRIVVKSRISQRNISAVKVVEEVLSSVDVPRAR